MNYFDFVEVVEIYCEMTVSQSPTIVVQSHLSVVAQHLLLKRNDLKSSETIDICQHEDYYKTRVNLSLSYYCADWIECLQFLVQFQVKNFDLTRSE